MDPTLELRPRPFRRPPAGGTAVAALFAVLAALVLPAPPLLASEVRVSILDPGPFDPVSGRITVELQAEAPDPVDPVDRIELHVDGRLVTVLTDGPPWRVEVDLGQENEEHFFRAVAHTASGATGEMSVQTPAIEVDEVLELPLQQLYVTVTRGGDRVTGLERDDFRVIDDGQVQELVTFEGGDAPLTAVLLVDSSESMRGERLQAAVRGAEAFTAGMKELDEAMTMLFADRLLRASPFTHEPAELRSSLAGARAGGGTALADHLYAAFKVLDGRQGRRVVVVLSDGFDVYSALGMEDVLWKARRSQAIVYWIQLQDRSVPGAEPGLFTSAWRAAEENQAEYEALRRLVLDSGGRIEAIERIDEVEGAFESILAELRDQYVLGYYPTELRHDGSWRQVRVRVRGTNDVRVREGYVDF